MTNKPNSKENLEVFFTFGVSLLFTVGVWWLFFFWMLFFSFMSFLGPRGKPFLNLALGARAR